MSKNGFTSTNGLRYEYAKCGKHNKHEASASRQYRSDKRKGFYFKRHCLICFAEIDSGQLCDNCADYVRQMLSERKRKIPE